MPTFPCPNCAMTIRAPDDTEGRAGRCRTCGTTVIVPGGDPPVLMEAGPAFALPQEPVTKASGAGKMVRMIAWGSGYFALLGLTVLHCLEYDRDHNAIQQAAYAATTAMWAILAYCSCRAIDALTRG